MEIRVMYHNGTLDFVPVSLLSYLFANRKAKQFQRGDGWAVAGAHKIRIREQLTFIGQERRHDRAVSPKIMYI